MTPAQRFLIGRQAASALLGVVPPHSPLDIDITRNKFINFIFVLNYKISWYFQFYRHVMKYKEIKKNYRIPLSRQEISQENRHYTNINFYDYIL